MNNVKTMKRDLHVRRERKEIVVFGIFEMNLDRKLFDQDDQQQTSYDVSSARKFSTTSSGTTEPSRPSSKKVGENSCEGQISLIVRDKLIII